MKETFTTLPTPRKVALMAAAAAVVSVFLPWVSILGLSVSGISTGDGKLVLVVAAAALVVLASHAGLLSVFELSTRVTNIVSAAAAALCLLVAIADLGDFAAIGLYVLLIASIAWVVAAVVSLREPKHDTPEPEAPTPS